SGVTRDAVSPPTAAQGAPPAAPRAKPAPKPMKAEDIPLRGPAATLARFMEQSRSIPTAPHFPPLAADTLAHRRGTLKAAGKKISFTHIIAWAIVKAAQEMPF